MPGSRPPSCPRWRRWTPRDRWGDTTTIIETAIAAAEQIAPSTLTRLVTALEELGYVERCAVPGDARSSTLTITACGHEALERIRRETTVVLADSLRTLSADQLTALAAALPALERLSDADQPDRRDPAGR